MMIINVIFLFTGVSALTAAPLSAPLHPATRQREAALVPPPHA